MTVSAVFDAAGRRRSPATLPGYHAGRAPRNKGMHYPADPPTVEEIIAVMRQAGDNPHGWRLRALTVVLWRGGLRIQEALALGERDLDPRRGSLLVRSGKGGRRREIGMDMWGWEQVQPWLTARLNLPVGPLFCIIDGATCRTLMVKRWCARRASLARRSGWRATPIRTAPATPCPRGRTRARGRPTEHHPTPARPRKSGDDINLPAGHRHRGDNRCRPHKTRPNDVRHRGPAPLRSAVYGREHRHAPARHPTTHDSHKAQHAAVVPLVQRGCVRLGLRDARFCWRKRSRSASPSCVTGVERSTGSRGGEDARRRYRSSSRSGRPGRYGGRLRPLRRSGLAIPTGSPRASE